MKKTITILSFLLAVCIQNSLYAVVRTSAQSGFFSAGSTWVGGAAPGPYDDIIISSGHTVTLDADATVFNITIQSGATLDNATYLLTIDRTSTGNPIYNNNGTHNGTGYLIAYDDFKTELSGNGITNCTIIIRSYGLGLLNDCQLTINGNIQHASPGNNGMNGKILIETQIGASLTINGDIITNPVYGGVGIENGANIIVNGNVSLPGSSGNGSGASITNFAGGTFNVSGNLSLGPYYSYCANSGSMTIGGDLLGYSFDETFFVQGVNSVVKFGGQIFPDSNPGYFDPLIDINFGPAEPNTVEYTGLSAQIIVVPAGGAYSNLIIGNSDATATVNSFVTVNGDLSIKSGSALTVGAGGSLSVGGTTTIESDATGTGSFISNSAVNANVKRYIAGHNSNANDGWHFLSSPVASQAISAFHTPGSGDFYKWDEATNTWINRTASGGGLNGLFEENFVPGRGYMIANNTTDTKTFSGSINASNLDVTGLTYTGSSSYAGWQLLGNPFSSAISWNNGNWALNNVDANAQIWNEANASYTVVLPNEVIPSMNGFMVHASQNNASLTIPASARLHSNFAWYKSANNTERIVLTAFDAEGQTAQSTIIRFDGSATEGYDNNYDSHFLAGLAPMFYSISQDYKLALNTLPQLAGSSSIPLGFVKNSSSTFSIELTENIPGQAVYLTDLKTNETVNLTETNYSYGSSEGDDVNRFLLHFSLLGLDEPGTADGLKAWVYDGQLYLLSPEPGDVTIYDIRGRKLSGFRSDTSDLQSHPLNSPSGVYIISFQGRASVKTAKVIVQ
ncbi:MAG: hypothetical protein FD170_2862 [Bacteroidetes bacterium]|nr:MAG: hypothetical protein FD170_2862 [Bacteroidota bacterium]